MVGSNILNGLIKLFKIQQFLKYVITNKLLVLLLMRTELLQSLHFPMMIKLLSRCWRVFMNQTYFVHVLITKHFVGQIMMLPTLLVFLFLQLTEFD